MANSIRAQGNTPPHWGIDGPGGDDYWEKRALEEDKQTRGASESPYAPRYNNNDYRSNTKALSSAPQKTNTLSFLEALQHLKKLTLQWETTPITRRGIISLEDKSVPIEYSYNSSSGISYLKWGDKTIHIKDRGASNNYPEINDFMYVLLACLETAYQYSDQSQKSMKFPELYDAFVSRETSHTRP